MQQGEQPLRIGILGAARIAGPALMNVLGAVPGLRADCIASRKLSQAQAFAEKYNVRRALKDYRAVVEDPAIDAIYIPLPNSLHAEWAIKGLEAGKAVLCEKPLAMNADEAHSICAAVERTGGVFVEAFHYRFHPFIHRIKALLDGGAIGEVRGFEVRAQVPGAWIPSDNIRRIPELGGGAAMDLGIYCVDTLRFLTGALPEVISAEAEQSDPGIDGTMIARLRFPNGVEARLRASHIYTQPVVDSVLIVEGDKGSLTASRHFLPQRGGSFVVENDKGRHSEAADETPTYQYQAAAFVDHARRTRMVETDARSGLENMNVIDAMYRAAGMRPRGLS